MRRILLATGITLGCIAVIGLPAGPDRQLSLYAQGAQKKSESRRSKSRNDRDGKSINAKSLEARVNKAEEQFIRETLEVAKEFEEAGQLEKSKQLYRSVLKIRSNLPGIKQKIDEIEESILSSNVNEIEIDVSEGWGPPRARVFKEKEFRLQAEGRYRFIANLQIGPGGFPTENPEQGEMASGVSCGALMGLIVSKDRAGKPKPGKPFEIGSSREFTPKEDGLLFLRVNVPPGHKSSGKISVTLSGYVRSG